MALLEFCTLGCPGLYVSERFWSFSKPRIGWLPSKVDDYRYPLRNSFNTYKYRDNTCKNYTCRWTHLSSIGSILVSIFTILAKYCHNMYMHFLSKWIHPKWHFWCSIQCGCSNPNTCLTYKFENCKLLTMLSGVLATNNIRGLASRNRNSELII